MVDIDSMSKKQLESFARKELDIELDRRHNKKDLLKRVKSERLKILSKRVTPAPSIKEEPSSSAVETLAENLNFDPYIGVIVEARAQVGDDLEKVKEHIEFLNNTSQENYQLILTEIDKYKD